MQTQQIPAALIWLDRRHALVAREFTEGALVTEVDRDFAATESSYLLEIVRQAADTDRIVVMGPDGSRVAFEREYVSLYQRPERLVDAGDESEPNPRELVDRLRFILGGGDRS